MTGATRARARRKAERPQELLEAAFQEFTLKGFEATRLEDVAQRAGVTKGTIYVYFENKGRLFETLLNERGKEQREKFSEFLDVRSDPTPDAIRADLVLLLRTIANDPRGQELLRLLIAEALRFPNLVDEHFEQVFDPVIAHLGARLKAAADLGYIRRAPVLEHPELLMSPALAMHICRLLFAERWPLDVEGYIAASVDLFMGGLALEGRSTKAGETT